MYIYNYTNVNCIFKELMQMQMMNILNLRIRYKGSLRQDN